MLIETPESSQTRRNLVVENLSPPPTILVVDDEDTVRDLLREYLTNSGYRVLIAADGMEALTLSQEHQGPINLLLTDVLMPGMNGSTLAARMAAGRPETKVLYISGYTPSIGVHHSVPNPGTAFLPKPFTREVLLSTIRIVMEAH